MAEKIDKKINGKYYQKKPVKKSTRLEELTKVAHYQLVGC